MYIISQTQTHNKQTNDKNKHMNHQQESAVLKTFCHTKLADVICNNYQCFFDQIYQRFFRNNYLLFLDHVRIS